MNDLEKKWDERLIKRIKKGGVVTDRSFNAMKPDPGELEIIGKFNYQTKMVHDVYSDFLFREHLLPIEKLTEDLFKPEDSKAIIRFIDSFRSMIPQVTFTDSDFRRIIGLPRNNYINKKIAKLVRDYTRLRIEGDVAIYWDEENRCTHKMTLVGSLVDVLIDEPERIKGNYPEHKYHFSMNLGGFFHFQNMYYHRIKLFPQKFYRMRPGAQNLGRYLAQYREVTVTFKDMVEIIGYPKDVKNERQRVKEIVKYLEEIKSHNYIRKYSI